MAWMIFATTTARGWLRAFPGAVPVEPVRELGVSWDEAPSGESRHAACRLFDVGGALFVVECDHEPCPPGSTLAQGERRLEVLVATSLPELRAAVLSDVFPGQPGAIPIASPLLRLACKALLG